MYSFSALTPFIRHQEGHSTCKNLTLVILKVFSVKTDVVLWCHQENMVLLWVLYLIRQFLQILPILELLEFAKYDNRIFYIFDYNKLI